MAQTNYYLGKMTNSAGESEINLRLYVSRDIRLRIGSGIWIDRKRWGKKNDINIPLIQGEERELLLEKKVKLNVLTDVLEQEINACGNKTIISRGYMETVVKKFHKPPKGSDKIREETFFSTIENYLCKRKLSVQRQKNFNVLVRCLKRFELYKQKTENKNFKLILNNLSSDQVRQIENFLAEEKSVFFQFPEIYAKVPYSSKTSIKTPVRQQKVKFDTNENPIISGIPKERGQNSIVDMMKRFRAFILWANDNGYTGNNPFKHYSVGESVYGTPIYINNGERKRLYETDISDNPSLATQRDIFVFQCLIGCRVSDLYKMTERNIIDGSIEYIPRKTKEDRPITVRVPLNRIALEVVARYRDQQREFLLPFISEQKYNVKIKEAFKRAGLDRMVTTIDQRTRQEVQRPLCEIASSHMARRTFIGNIYKKVKDPNLVSALSGHKDGSKAFARYRTIDDEMKKELIDLLE